MKAIKGKAKRMWGIHMVLRGPYVWVPKILWEGRPIQGAHFRFQEAVAGGAIAPKAVPQNLRCDLSTRGS